MTFTIRTLASTIGKATIALSLLSGAAFADEQAAAPNVADLTAKIVAIGQANQTRRDNLAAVRAELEPLVAELLAAVPAQTEAAKKEAVAGGWRYLWADQFLPPTLDFTQIYQVVEPTGYYYNIARQPLPFGGSLTNYLRGKYTDAGDHLNIEFTRNAYATGWLAAGTSLKDLGLQVEAGQVKAFDSFGPIGVKGTLTDAYVDSELRIVKGTDATEPSTLFILTRSDVIAPR